MGRERLADLKFDEAQVREIMARASEREAERGGLTSYDDLIADGVEAGIPEEYLIEEIGGYAKTRIVKVKTDKEGKLERQVQDFPKSLSYPVTIAKYGFIPAGVLIGMGIVKNVVAPEFPMVDYLNELYRFCTSAVGISFLVGYAKDWLNSED